jgi:hypothetical protein
MRHAIRFEGGFERNFPTLRAGADSYEGDDGSPRPIAAWPPKADGLRFGFMEQPGKRFVAVRVGFGDQEVVLGQPLRIDPDRHMGGRRFSAEPIELDESPASALLGDILDANPDQRAALSGLRERVRDAMGPDAPQGTPYR